MKIVVENNYKKESTILNFVMQIFGYACILILMSYLFGDTLKISNELYGLYPILASIIIYALNKTIKPLLFILFLPITAITLGVFYPFINVVILYITSFFLGDKFQLTNNLVPVFFMAVAISLLSFIYNNVVISKIGE